MIHGDLSAHLLPRDRICERDGLHILPGQAPDQHRRCHLPHSAVLKRLLLRRRRRAGPGRRRRSTRNHRSPGNRELHPSRPSAVGAAVGCWRQLGQGILGQQGMLCPCDPPSASLSTPLSFLLAACAIPIIPVDALAVHERRLGTQRRLLLAPLHQVLHTSYDPTGAGGIEPASARPAFGEQGGDRMDSAAMVSHAFGEETDEQARTSRLNHRPGNATPGILALDYFSPT